MNYSSGVFSENINSKLDKAQKSYNKIIKIK
jgi:hypothetical protein